MTTLNLFEPTVEAERVDERAAAGWEQKAEAAVNALLRLLQDLHPLAGGLSGGKDSSCVVSLMLEACRRLIEAGRPCPPVFVLHIDTLVESPAAKYIAEREIAKIRNYARQHSLPVEVLVGHPTLNSTFAMRVISGRALPSYPNLTGDCQLELKVIPARKLAADALQRAGAQATKPLVTIIGTRSDESAARAVSTRERGETSECVWTNAKGELMLSPVLHWSTDDVFEHLGSCAAGLFRTYSDFAEVMQFYADAGGSSCAVVGELTSRANSKPCGARSGCHVCVRSSERTAHAMVASNPQKYRYLEPLLRFRNFLAGIQYDWSRRSMLRRTIDADGYIHAHADQFSPSTCEELLRYALFAQEEANRLGSPTKVSIVSIRELIGIDFYWSVRGMFPPFHALKIYFDHEDGVDRREAPVISHAARKSPEPYLGKVYVGPDWDTDVHATLGVTGLRQPIWELFGESCGRELRTSARGKVFLDVEEGDGFDVDEQGAWDFLDFMGREMVDKHHRPTADYTLAASTYLMYGTLTLGKGQSADVDKAIRRSQWRQRHELHLPMTMDEVWERCSIKQPRQDSLFKAKKLEDFPVVQQH